MHRRGRGAKLNSQQVPAGGKKRGCPKRQVPTVDERYEVNYGGEGVSLGHLGRVVGAHEKVVVTRKVGEV